MINNNLKISIVIIGFNTKKHLINLLRSINEIKESSDVFEVIYIDDGSSDKSFEAFQRFNLLFTKHSKRLIENSGRSVATQEGINIARGNWLLFVRSNELVSSSLIEQYKKAIKKNALAYMGLVIYRSSDAGFQKYLNSNKRGIKSCSSISSIHYRFLLFNNSLIHRSVFNKITLNPLFRHYGGEELECSYKINQNFPGSINACKGAVVYRNNYPSLSEQCKRLEEFGATNFKLLSTPLKLDVVYCRFLLANSLFLRILVSLVDCVCALINALCGSKKLYLFIQLQLLTAILKGYYRGS